MDSVHDSSSVEVGPPEDVQAGAVEVYGDGPGGGPGDTGANVLSSTGDGATRWRRSSPSVLVGVIVAWFIQLPYYALTPGAAPEVSTLIKVPACPPPRAPGLGAARLCGADPLACPVLPVLLAGPERRHLSERARSSAVRPRPSTPPRARSTCPPPSRPQRSWRFASSATRFRSSSSAHLSTASCRAHLPLRPSRWAMSSASLTAPRCRHTSILSKRLEALAPGTTVHLVVSAYPAGKARDGKPQAGRVPRARARALTTAFPRAKARRYKILKFVTVTGGKPHPVACMGIYPQGSGGTAIDGTAFKVGPLPVKVDLSSEGIVGPSAGLAFTLGLMEELDRGRPHRRPQGRRDRDDVDRRDCGRRRRGRPEDDRRARRGGKRLFGARRRSTPSQRPTRAVASRCTP